MEPTLLLTGFEPFDGVPVNPSGEIVRALDRQWLEGSTETSVRVRAAVLPVSFARTPAAIAEALHALAAPPVALLSLGVHRGPEFRLERRARSTFHSAKPDNDGVLGAGEVAPGPAERVATVDVSVAEAALRYAGAEATVLSDDAGGYLCERAYRAGLDHAEEGGFPALFLHVPPLEFVSLEHQVRVVRGFAGAFANGFVTPS